MGGAGKKILKVGLGFVVASGIVAGAGYVFVTGKAQARLDHTWPEVKGKDFAIPFPLTQAEIDAINAERLANAGEGEEVVPVSDDVLAKIAGERAFVRGKSLIEGRLACGECHGVDGAGKLVADAQPVWTWYAPNITKGGATKAYSASDWDRIVRHGVKKDGTTATMPAVDFVKVSDQELSDIAHYFSSVKATDVPQPPISIGPVGYALLAFNQLPLAAEQIDHTEEHREYPPEPAISEEFGEHVSATCVGCHGLDFTGGPIKAGPPDWPPAANLTKLQDWTEEDWMRVFKDGVRKDGEPLQVPMSDIIKAKVSDTEIKSMFKFLQTLEPKEASAG